MEFTSGNSGHSRDQVVTVASQDGVCRTGMPGPAMKLAVAVAAVVLVVAWNGPIAVAAAAVILILAVTVAVDRLLRRRR